MTLTRQVLRLAPLALGLSSAACVPSDRPTMNPGVDCVACHTVDTKSRLPNNAPDDPGERAPSLAWSFGGTVYKDTQGTAALQGVHLLIKDSLGTQVDVTSNEAGNFYSSESIDFTAFDPVGGDPVYQVYAEYPAGSGKKAFMGTHPTPVSIYGSTTLTLGVGCNGCHSQPNYLTKPGPAGTGTPADCHVAFPDAGERMGLAVGENCGSRTECCSNYCIDGQCSATPGEWGHQCSDSSDAKPMECAAHDSDNYPGYCRNGYCAGAKGRIGIRDSLTPVDANGDPITDPSVTPDSYAVPAPIAAP